MRKIFCDICGKDTTNNYGSMELEMPLKEESKFGFGPRLEFRHFCSECCNKLLKFIDSQGKEK